MIRLLVCFTVIGALFHSVSAAPQSFSEAKVQARQKVYYDRNQSEQGTLYCGCKWVWTGKSGGKVNLASCGYTPRRNAFRAARIEWEHIVPAWVMGHQRQCWQHGSRKNCTGSDPVFRIMEADLQRSGKLMAIEVISCTAWFRKRCLTNTDGAQRALISKTRRRNPETQ